MNLRNRFPARRRFLKQSAALSACASLAAPAAVLAQVGGCPRVGLLHDVDGAPGDIAPGCGGRAAALLALREIGRGGAAVEPVLGDGVAHVAAMQARGIGVLVLQAPAAACVQALEPLPAAASVWVLAPAARAVAPVGATVHDLAERSAPPQRPAVLSSYAAVRVAALALLQSQARATPVRLALTAHGAQPLSLAELALRRGLQTLIVLAG